MQCRDKSYIILPIIHIYKSLGITYCLYHHAWWYAFITVWLRQMWAIKQKILCRKLQY